MKTKNYKKQKYKKDNSFAFTLAEVLITLGIIGVVAAFTIPNLIQNSVKQETATKLQKIYSIISQAHKNAELEMGSSTTWGNPTTEWNPAASNAWWNEYFIPYSKLSINKSCTNSNASVCWASNAKYLDGATLAPSSDVRYVLNDGTSLTFFYISNSYGTILADINGLKKPNVVGKDIFVIILNYKAGYVSLNGQGLSRKYILDDNNGSCNKELGASKGNACGGLIQQDGWKIADDYPWN